MIRVALLSNHLPSAVRCLTTLWATEPDLPRSQVTLRGTWGAWEQPESLRGVVYARQETPFCLTREWNRAAATEPGADILQLEDDVTFTVDRPVTTMQKVMAAHGRRAIVQPSLAGEILMNDVMRPGNRRRFKYTESMPLVCALHPGDVWTALGGLDERFDSYGCDDNDYCYRARRAGVALVVLDYLSIRHETGRSGFRKDGRTVSMDRSIERFTEKWGAWPAPPVPYPEGWTGPAVPD